MKKQDNKIIVDDINENGSLSSSVVSTVDLINSKGEKQPKEYGGRKDGLDPTRYGDWEKNGRCIDF